MKRLLFTICLFIIAANIFAQTPFRKKVYHKVTSYLVEEYDTKDSLSSMKVGYYARYNPKSGKMTKNGSYKDNIRSGIWTFYNDSLKVSYKYNYTTGMLLFSKPDTLAKYFLKQANVDTNFYSDLTFVPEFIGGSVEYKDFITSNLKYPAIAKENDIKGTVIATFYVAANGFAESPKIVKGIGFGCDEEVIRVINLMPRWLPGRKQSEVKQLYYMAFKFEPKK